MKLLSKLTAAALMLILLLQIITLCCTVTAPSAEEIAPEEEIALDIQYKSMTKFGDIDDTGTLFVDDVGNLYAVDAQYPEQSGSQFLLKIDTHNNDDPTDDIVLSVWAAPVTR